MAGSNPVFSRIDKQLDQQPYAGFGQPQQQQQPQQWSQTGPTAYQDQLSADQLERMYQQPPAGPVAMGRVTFDDVIMKTLGLFALLVVVAGVSWAVTAGSPGLTTPVWLLGMFGGLAVGLAIAFMKKVSVPLIVTYAVLEGAFVGAFSRVMEQAYPGIVVTAVLATLCTFAGMFLGYKTGLVKVTNKSRRIFGFAIMGYLLFSLVNVFALFLGLTTGWGFGGSGLLGIGISLLGVGLASYSLAIDFDSIDHAVRVGAPERFSWLLAHGLIVSVVWLYLEIVRLLARMRD
ncbi:MAG: Bax inhibitor-1/YccA family protein [Dermatophilaceae bacterium]